MKDFLKQVVAKAANCLSIIKRGQLPLCGLENVDCANASDGRKVLRLISAQSFFQIVGVPSNAHNPSANLAAPLGHPKIMSSKERKIFEDLAHPIRLMDGKDVKDYYDHALLIDYAKTILRLRRAKRLPDAFWDYANNCELFITGLANVGLAAMIDEATGYDKQKKRKEYLELFRGYIREHQSDWEKEFPDEFFDGVYGIYHLEKSDKKGHPQFFAHFILKYIYTPLANSKGAILEILKEKDPIVSSGRGRKYKLHQFLSDNIGKPELRRHLASVNTLLRISDNKGVFDRLFKKAFPQRGDQMEFDFDDL